MALGFNQTLQYSRVISRYYMMDYDQFSEAFSDFIETVTEAGYSPTDGIFYAINTDIRQKRDMVVQVFLPVEEEHIYALPDEYSYQSYFQVLNMLGTRVMGDSEQSFDRGLNELISIVVEQDLDITTPPFFKVTVDEILYTDILLGVR